MWQHDGPEILREPSWPLTGDLSSPVGLERILFHKAIRCEALDLREGMIVGCRELLWRLDDALCTLKQTT
jgi:hypothetical protein